ncbi:diaminopimelate decarboxylase [Camelliibacillus cellulosilyticus]|uniref:Diaminopimelate decarboxylase n=1 Tax=Camelliibacillus cellulosilyticus TaxID=2174486 RepID=A0ABV9GJV7_9BACL
MRGTQSVNDKGHLMIGAVDTVALAKTYGTPLYVYDVALIREKAQAFKKAFADYPAQYQIAYASKAFSSVAMIQLVEELDLALDVVSGGELYTALAAEFPPEKIHFHGNNKSVDELRYAVREGIGAIIVDNFYELAMLEQVAAEESRQVRILLRLTPGVQTNTHAYIATGQEDSKFGFYFTNGDAFKAVENALDSPWLRLEGVHFHLGSQLFDPKTYIHAIQRLYKEMDQWHDQLNFIPKIVNVGGGFGIPYTDEDQEVTPAVFIEAITQTIMDECGARSLSLPEIWIEPGRVLVGEAGTTLYTLGSQKTTAGGRTYISVDGGMSDNLRPALYQSKYEAALAAAIQEPPVSTVTLAGKCCESGDIVIQDIDLPNCQSGDVLAVFCTGAYGYAMANNYNRLPRPAVVFVEAGDACLVVERETYQDLIHHDLPLGKKVISKSVDTDC